MPQTRPEHDPQGDPCTKCGVRAESHRKRKRERIDVRVTHEPIGEPCAECGLDAKMHRKAGQRNPQKYKNYKTFIGIDGEGFESGSVYAYICAATKDDEVSHTECIQGRGLTTEKCLDFIVDLPKKPLKFGFSLNYDFTQILRDLDEESLWKLNHPESRTPAKGPAKPILWSPKGDQDTVYELNLLSAKFTVRKLQGHKEGCQDDTCRACFSLGRNVLWDIFKFFQSSFISACRDWDVISEDEFLVLKKMKAGRSEFKRPSKENDPDWIEIKRYCALECRKMAELGAKLVEAHNAAGLQLRSYYGAGSTGGTMLESMGAEQYMKKRYPSYNLKLRKQVQKLGRLKYPPELQHAIGCGFFGGRFEISRVGPYLGPVWSYDIASAYPYAICFLPCLVHGSWEHRTMHDGLQREVEEASAALVRYELPHTRGVGRINNNAWPKGGKESIESGYYGTCERAWGPLPFRDRQGNIVYPATSGGGWVYKREFLAAQRLYPNVKLVSAWVYNTDCSCRVFRDVMPRNYKLRLSWGKEGKGIVIKLGMNSCYGKMAQSKGPTPKYQSFLWAGMTTASCRAQLLLAMHQTKRPESILSVATDGIMSAEELELPRPADTGTFEPVNGKVKPLGSWEAKKLERGMMFIRPGIVFSLDEDLKEKEVKARGIGKSLLAAKCGEVMRRWYDPDIGERDMVFEKNLFFGMKSQITRTPSGVYNRHPNYGRFAEMQQSLSYHAEPKRPPKYLSGTTNRLMTWALAPDAVSLPYGPAIGEKAKKSNAAKALGDLKDINLDQPEWEDEPDELAEEG
jgi:hypothetical protein